MKAFYLFLSRKIVNRTWGFFAILTLINIAIYLFVLSTIHPKFLDPFWPTQRDYYRATHNALGQVSTAWDSRPVYNSIYNFLGQFGVRVPIFFTTILVSVNLALTGLLVQQLTHTRKAIFLVLYTMYAYLIITHPEFYSWHTHDRGTQLAYFFLILTGFALYKYTLNTASFWYIPFLFLLQLLSKETYAVSLVWAVGIFVVLSSKPAIKQRIRVLLAAVACLALASVYTWHSKAFFIYSLISKPTKSYVSDFSFHSVLSEYVHYLQKAFTPYSAALIAFVFGLLWINARHNRTNLLFSGVFCLAGLLSWLPNSVLPAHFAAGYSWNGAYLYIAPILFLNWPAVANKYWAIPLLLSTFLLPLTYKERYAIQATDIQNEKIQKNLLQTLQRFSTQIDPDEHRKVLVTVPQFLDNPFKYGYALLEYQNFKNTAFTIAVYTKEEAKLRIPLFKEPGFSVQWAFIDTLKSQNYTDTLALGSDGHRIYHKENRKGYTPAKND